MMYYGLPVINFDTGSSQDLIRHDKNGYIIKLKNVDDLSDSLIKINNMNHEKIKNMHSFTKDFAKLNFSFEKFKQKLIKIYENSSI